MIPDRNGAAATGATPAAPPRHTPLQQRASIDAAFALGVPRNYGQARRLRRIAEPAQLVSIGTDTQQRPQWLAPRAAAAWRRLQSAAAGDGVALQVVSAFRGIEYQLGIFQRKLARGIPIAQILQVNAAPGFSEHHSGRALDLTTPGFAALEESFETSPAFAWLQAHAASYGFVLSYPRDNRHGIVYEPWHWCWRQPASAHRTRVPAGAAQPAP